MKKRREEEKRHKAVSNGNAKHYPRRPPSFAAPPSHPKRPAQITVKPSIMCGVGGGAEGGGCSTAPPQASTSMQRPTEA